MMNLKQLGVTLIRRLPNVTAAGRSIGQTPAGRCYCTHPLLASATQNPPPLPSELNSQLFVRPWTRPTQFSPQICNKEYILPSSMKRIDPEIKILDPLLPKLVDLPPLFQNKLEIVVPSIESVQKVVEDPPSAHNSIQGVIIEKHAKNVLKYRRRRMNRHKLKKLRKRMKFLYIKLSQRKAKRRERYWKQMQDDIIQAAHDWDPKREAEEFLDRARTGGFKLDVFTTGRSGDNLSNSK